MLGCKSVGGKKNIGTTVTMKSSRWANRINRFMRVKPICYAVFHVRYFYFTKIKRALRAYDDQLGVAEREHNFRAIHDGKPSDRILGLVLPLSVIDRMTPESTVLAVGCRYETDLLYLAAYGFSPRNIRGLDIFSYSPWVDLGNMHKMPYGDSSWDAVMLGWVLPYSSEPELAAREIVRVTRRGGLVAIGITYYPEEGAGHLLKDQPRFGRERRNRTVDGMLDLFGDHVETVYFRHDVSDPNHQGPCLVVFSIRK